MARRPISIGDLESFRLVSDIDVSPDESRVLFSVTRVIRDQKNWEYESNIWEWSRGGIRQITFREGRNISSKWSPDGRNIAFISKQKMEEKERIQLFVLPSDGGEAKLLLTLEGEKKGTIKDIRWSPNGRQIYFLSDYRDGKLGQSDVKVVTRIYYRLNAEGFLHDRRSRLFSIKAEGGKPLCLTEGDFDVSGYAPSPAGDKIAFISNLTREADYTVVKDIYVIPARAGQKPSQITASKGPIYSLAWSPKGDKIAYIGHDMRRGLATNAGVWLIPIPRGEATNVTRGFDRSARNTLLGDTRVPSIDPSPVWSPEGRFIYFLATDGGSCNLYRTDLKGRVEQITRGDRCVDIFSFSADHRILAFSSMNAHAPAEAWVRDGAGERKITDFNGKLLQRLQLSEPQPFAFKASDGVKIEGWFAKPVGRKREKPPAILEVHGGPRATYGHTFFHEFQVWAANGYAIIYTNPRGSAGYGEDFAAHIVRNYGDRDYKDLMEAVDYVADKGLVDKERLGVTGGSYGGFMTNWIITHTNRFKAAITQRSISNWYSFYGTSDIGYYFAEHEVGGLPWEKEDQYIEKSPIHYVRNVQTPLLICHPEDDYRCPIEQGEQFFVALKALRKEAVMLRFPRENHELSRSGKPKHRIERLQHFLAWFNRYLKK